MKRNVILFFILFYSRIFYSQQIKIEIVNFKENKTLLYSLNGELTSLVDSIHSSTTGQFIYKPKAVLHKGIYRLTFNNNQSQPVRAKTEWIDFIYEGNDIELKTDLSNLLDSMKVFSSVSNKLFYSFIKLNNQYKTKTELLQLIFSRFPKDDTYYLQTKERLNELQNEYIQFVNVTSQKEPTAFVARYIRSSQLPTVDVLLPIEKHLDYLKAHALDNINFKDVSLLNSDLFTNKTIEYLNYYKNSQLPKELLEKEFMKSIDSLLSRAKVNQLVYQHITEYLIDGFKSYGFDQIIDYILENYVIKDDLCLNVKTEGLIKRRIEHAKYFKIGNIVPNISMPDVDGKKVSLKKIKKEKILIVFYASLCPHCQELLPKLNELKKSLGGDKFEILTISLDNKKEDWTSFVKYNCSYLLNVSDLKGWDGKTANDYFIYATPTMFLVDKDLQLIGKPMTINDVEKLVLGK